MSFTELPDGSNGVVDDVSEVPPTTNKKSSDGQSKLIVKIQDLAILIEALMHC